STLEELRPAEPVAAQPSLASSEAVILDTKAPELSVSSKEPQNEIAGASRPSAARAVSPEIQGLVTRADALWSGGDQATAVTLYQEVLRAVGKQHYLGQRASARIAQAEREK